MIRRKLLCFLPSISDHVLLGIKKKSDQAPALASTWKKASTRVFSPALYQNADKPNGNGFFVRHFSSTVMKHGFDHFFLAPFTPR
jgi:hypothetical protein